MLYATVQPGNLDSGNNKNAMRNDGDTTATRIVNAAIFKRNGSGAQTMKLWRDYVTATLAVDGGIVF
jgi:hypothetical protein